MTALPSCAALAAMAYHVPPAIVASVADHAGGHGVGIMGIPEEWLPILGRLGFDPALVRSDVCINIAAGAWIVAWASRGKPEALKSAGAPPSEPTVPFDTPKTLPTDEKGCITAAASRYHLPELLFRAILMTEGGSAGHISWNHNGSYDMGPAQVNSSWLPRLAGYGITREQVIDDACLNIHVGAWILAQAIDGATPANPAEFWRHVGNYNSATPRFNRSYQMQVWHNVQIASRSQPGG